MTSGIPRIGLRLAGVASVIMLAGAAVQAQ